MKKWRRQWHPTPVLLPGKSHGRRSLIGCSPWGRYKLDMTERLHSHFSLPCIGEGNGSPLQCSCLENPRDGGAWWTAVYGVAHSWTRLKWLSSSSSSSSEKVVEVSVTQSCLTLLTSWTVAHQAPLSMDFSGPEYWNRWPFRFPGDLPDPRIKPKSPTLHAASLLSEPSEKPCARVRVCACVCVYLISSYHF